MNSSTEAALTKLGAVIIFAVCVAIVNFLFPPDLHGGNPAMLLQPGEEVSAQFDKGVYAIIALPVPTTDRVFIQKGVREDRGFWAPGVVLADKDEVNYAYIAIGKPVWVAIVDGNAFNNTSKLPDAVIDSLFAALQTTYGADTCSKINGFVDFVGKTTTIDDTALRVSLNERCA